MHVGQEMWYRVKGHHSNNVIVYLELQQSNSISLIPISITRSGNEAMQTGTALQYTYYEWLYIHSNAITGT